ncbi:hypothetical protein FEP07_01341 [Burkholderia multivorans]|nr:hypothetical protein [Burkholderia multivorans]MDR9268509.1 hypothetical protein [Burkholderia multivorans]MDR9284079.1 hypothetical protein [Burkholderia multivorans]MDR9292232.1 hypothetical protein [Burkholderia multivorans]MDR9314478.1 hypothetical protein [Burkholderia multivorans]
MDRPSHPHHRNSRFESLRDPPIHINKRDFDDYPPALIAQTPSNRTVRTMPVSTTKSAPRRILRLALTIKIHSDSSRSGTHLSTWINGSSMMTRRHSASGFLRFDRPRAAHLHNKIRASVNRLCGAHHRNSQQLESLPRSPIHMNKRQFDDDSGALSARVPCGSIVHAIPVPTTKIRASANRSSHPHHRNSQRFQSLRCRHIHIAEPIWTDRSSALAIQVRNASSFSVTDVSTTENPASPGRPPRTHRRNSQRSECLCRRPIHIPNRASMNR